MGTIHSALLMLSMIMLSWFLCETHCEPICSFATFTCLFYWAGLVKITLLWFCFFFLKAFAVFVCEVIV